MSDGSKKPQDLEGEMTNFSGILDGMANLLGKLGELAEKGESLKRSGQFESKDGKSVAGSYGFSVRFGPGGERSDDVKVAPHQRTATKQPEPKAPRAPEPREPQVDVFHESDHVLVVAEMPGVAAEEIELEFTDESMKLVGQSARVRFEKIVELGFAFAPQDVETRINNGVVEIRLKRTKASGEGSE